MEIKCIECNLPPNQIQEYVEAVKDSPMTPEQYVMNEEGTYNPANGHFVCTECYIKIGMPSAPGGWKAP